MLSASSWELELLIMLQDWVFSEGEFSRIDAGENEHF